MTPKRTRDKGVRNNILHNARLKIMALRGRIPCRFVIFVQKMIQNLHFRSRIRVFNLKYVKVWVIHIECVLEYYLVNKNWVISNADIHQILVDTNT